MSDPDCGDAVNVILDVFMQENGKATTGPDLSVKLNGLTLPNPFVIGSGKLSIRLQIRLVSIAHHQKGGVTHVVLTGPPGTNYAVMKKAFDEGWGGVIAKTVSVDSSKACRRHLAALPCILGLHKTEHCRCR